MIKKILYISPFFLFIAAVINNKIIYDGTLAGIKLILFTVLPTLFPFIFISDLMVSTHTTDKIAYLLSPVTQLAGLSTACGYPIVSGLLCGYPLGAKSCADLVNSGEISPCEGNYLLAFVNNASPAFLGSYITSSLLFNKVSSSYIFLISYISALLTALIFLPLYKKAKKDSQNGCFDMKKTLNTKCKSGEKISYEKIFMSTTNTLLKISGYILLFSILCEFIKYIPNIIPRMILSGLLEITTGTFFISTCSIPFSVKFILIMYFTTLGGISTVFQTHSVICKSKLSLKWYICGKITSSTISLILCLPVCRHIVPYMY